MSTFEDGITFGGGFVIEHQKKETMAAVLLARKGEDELQPVKIQFSLSGHHDMTVLSL